MNFDNICIFHKHLRPTCDAEKKFVKKKITEANFSNLVSYLLYAYQKKSTEKLLAKSILWAKLDMRILQRLALKLRSCSIKENVMVFKEKIKAELKAFVRFL